MADYVFDITVPAATPRNTPYSERVLLDKGTITNVVIGFPSGCARQVKLVLYQHSRQIMPSRQDMAYAYDSYVFNRDVTIELADPPYSIEVQAWSPDAVYDHTLLLAFSLQLPGEAQGLDLYRALIGGSNA